MQYKMRTNVAKQNLDAVIYDIPSGKIDLSGQIKDQASQKGDTCWYYTLNFLRPRYGKDKVFQQTIGRKNELILSKFRKKLTELDELNQIAESVLESFSDTNIDKNHVTKRLAEINTSLNFLNREYVHPYEGKIYTGFLNQDEHKYLEEYIKYRDLETKIKTCKDTIQELGLGLEEEIKKYQKESGVKVDSSFLELVAYKSIIRLEANKLYNIKSSSWHPKQGIGSLIKELRDNGPLYIGGTFGGCFYDKPPRKLDDSFGNYDIYGWNKGEFEETPGSHTILIIGAKKEKESEYVYFLDTNDASSVNQPRRVYKMSYARLYSGIFNIYGVTAKHIDRIPGPFALCANNEKIQYLKEFRQAIVEFNKLDTLEKTEEINVMQEKTNLTI